MATDTTEKYQSAAVEGIRNPILQEALANLQERLGKGAAEAYRRLPEGPDLRLKAHDIRMESIEYLDILLDRLTQTITENGGHVFFAPDAESAITYLMGVARDNNVKRVVKGKSMVSEEIGVNDAFAAAGIEVMETDLGEYIVQLAGEHPSHIIAPAIHKTRTDIGRLFADTIGTPFTDDPPTLTRAARKALREKFLAADMGGQRVQPGLCRNRAHHHGFQRRQHPHVLYPAPCARGADGHGTRHRPARGSRCSVPSSFPRGRGPEHGHLRQLRRRAETAGSGRWPGCIPSGNPRQRPVENPGRSPIQGGALLYPLRRLSERPVPYTARLVGHAYGYPYSGPVGAVVTPLLVGINRAGICAREKRFAEPAGTLARSISTFRECSCSCVPQLAEGDPRWSVVPASALERIVYGIWSVIIGHRRLYDLVLHAGRFFQQWMPAVDGMIRRMPSPADGWTRGRNLKPLAKRVFMNAGTKRRCARE